MHRSMGHWGNDEVGEFKLSVMLDGAARRSRPRGYSIESVTTPMAGEKDNRYRAFAMEIGPDEAAAIMGRNVANRPISAATVAAYERDMREGKWKYGEAIIFSYLPGDDEPVLIDGQHRLMALQRAGVRLTFPVVVTPDEDVYPVIGRARRRNMVDLIHTDRQMRQGDIGREKLVANAINALCIADVLMEEGSLAFRTLTDQRRRELYLARKVDADYAISIQERRGRGRLLPIGVVGAAIRAHRENPSMADEFFDKVLTGEMIGKGEPAYALRELIIAQGLPSAKSAARRRANDQAHQYWYGITIGAWKRYLRGDTHVQLLRPLDLTPYRRPKAES